MYLTESKHRYYAIENIMYQLSRFTVIAATNNYGIGCAGKIPWRNTEDLAHFKSRTSGNVRMIVGRKTYEGLPKIVQRRNCVVISRSVDLGYPAPTIVVSSLAAALKITPEDSAAEYIVIGGGEIYREALTDYAYLCDEVLLTRIDDDHECDVSFPLDVLDSLNHRKTTMEGYSCRIETYDLRERNPHPEEQYLELLREILTKGEDKIDRTGVGCRSLFGRQISFDLRRGFPLLTTKRTLVDKIIRELLFFISGSTDNTKLLEQDVNFWTANTTQDFLKKYGKPWEENDMGPLYGFQWRHAGAKYLGCKDNYAGQGVDQLQNTINRIKSHPFSRDHVISAWNVPDIKDMAIPPCHCLFQFYVGPDENCPSTPKYLDLQLYQRSADMFLGVPFNIASYAFILHIVGKLTGLIARNYTHTFGDAHIYHSHYEQVHRQIKRTPLPFPKFSFNGDFDSIDNVKFNNLSITNYQYWPGIRATMAV